MSDEKPLSQGEVKFLSECLVLRWQAYEYRLEFQSRECGWGQAEDGTWTAPSYQFFSASGSQEFSDEFAHGDRFIDGAIKWDGCSHINFGDENGYLHLCGGHAFIALDTVLRTAFETASREVPHFDPKCADLEALRAAGGPTGGR